MAIHLPIFPNDFSTGCEEVAAKHAVDGCNIHQNKTVGSMRGTDLYHKDLSWVGVFSCCLPIWYAIHSKLDRSALVRTFLDIMRLSHCLLFVVSVCLLRRRWYHVSALRQSHLSSLRWQTGSHSEPTFPRLESFPQMVVIVREVSLPKIPWIQVWK